MRFKWSNVCLLVCGLLVVSGCSGTSPDPIVVTGVAYFATGTVTGDPTAGTDASAEVVGKPIVGAKVTFHDHDVAVGYGITDDLGRFRISSHPSRTETIDGLPEGLYAVTITKLSLVEVASPEGGSASSDEHPLPERYAHPDTTEWQLMKVKLITSTNHFHLAVKE